MPKNINKDRRVDAEQMLQDWTGEEPIEEAIKLIFDRIVQDAEEAWNTGMFEYHIDGTFPKAAIIQTLQEGFTRLFQATTEEYREEKDIQKLLIEKLGSDEENFHVEPFEHHEFGCEATIGITITYKDNAFDFLIYRREE